MLNGFARLLGGLVAEELPKTTDQLKWLYTQYRDTVKSRHADLKSCPSPHSCIRFLLYHKYLKRSADVKSDLIFDLSHIKTDTTDAKLPITARESCMLYASIRFKFSSP